MLLVYLLFNILILFNPSDKVETKSIIFYGDSITAGYGLGTDFAYPKLIETQLKNDGYDVEVVNGGLSGETSAGGLTRIDWMLNRDYDVFVLELGGNDGLRGIPVAETTSNLENIISKVRAKNPATKIVVAGMMVPPNMGQDYSEEFMGIFKIIAKKHNLTLIPFLLEDVAGIESLNLPDGIHPNAEGHQIVAKNIYPVIKGLL